MRAATAVWAIALAGLLLAGACTSGGGEEASPAGAPTSQSSPETPTAAPGATLTPPSAEPTAAPETPSSGPANPPTTELSLLTIVDKEHGLSPSYVPAHLTPLPPEWNAPGFFGHLLRERAVDALVKLLEAAREAGHELRVRSAYRSYDTQVTTFQYWVSQLGEAEARRVSAPPGHSEHQLGSAVDLTSAGVGWDLVESFGSTPEGEWLAGQAPGYGFALSYPEGTEAITGYAYEPWHLRYIGGNDAQAWSESGLTLIEYLEQLGG